MMTQTLEFLAYQGCCDDQAACAVSLARYVVWLHHGLMSSAATAQETPPEMHLSSEQSCILLLPTAELNRLGGV